MFMWVDQVTDFGLGEATRKCAIPLESISHFTEPSRLVTYIHLKNKEVVEVHQNIVILTGQYEKKILTKRETNKAICTK